MPLDRFGGYLPNLNHPTAMPTFVDGTGSGSVMQGSGAPTNPPTDATSAAIYTNLDDGVLYTWNVVTQAWI